MNTKFKVGDKVRIVNYGHAILMSKRNINLEESGFKFLKEAEDLPFQVWIDINPSLVGKSGEIVEVGMTGYSIKGIGSWFQDNQLEYDKEADS